jgi:2-phospho-L-lactate transferase/gluconeogenesis factor (CofD/UPF0052 family)
MASSSQYVTSKSFKGISHRPHTRPQTQHAIMHVLDAAIVEDADVHAADAAQQAAVEATVVQVTDALK